MDYSQRIKKAIDLIRGSDNITAFTGAGISTESGISDFRSPGGVWDRYRIVTYQEFQASEEKRKGYWQMKSELFKEMNNARPNQAHTTLSFLESIGKLRCLITQNIDGLHLDAGNSKETVIELHGTNRSAYCLSCNSMWPIEEIQERLADEDFDPRCNKCGGLIKPSTVSFGQPMPQEAMQRAIECSMNCDVFLMIGSSLQVEPAASIPPEAKRSGADLIFINRTETQWDHIASVVFNEDAGRVLGEIKDILNSDANYRVS
jgi:NAD-dependent deacetylase